MAGEWGASMAYQRKVPPLRAGLRVPRPLIAIWYLASALRECRAADEPIGSRLTDLARGGVGATLGGGRHLANSSAILSRVVRLSAGSRAQILGNAAWSARACCADALERRAPRAEAERRCDDPGCYVSRSSPSCLPSIYHRIGDVLRIAERCRPTWPPVGTPGTAGGAVAGGVERACAGPARGLIARDALLDDGLPDLRIAGARGRFTRPGPR